MKKEKLGLKPRLKLLYNADLDTTDLKSLFDYSSDYNLLSDILELMYHDVRDMKTRSRSGTYKHMILVIPCIEKLIYLEDINPTSPLYCKMEDVIGIIDEELSKKHNRELNTLLNKVKSELERIMAIINSDEYINRHKIELENQRLALERKECAKEIAKYILFDVKDIRLIIGLKNEYFTNAIIDDMDEIVERLCASYLSKEDERDYYYLLFVYLSSNPIFKFDEYYDYIVNTFKDYFKNKFKVGMPLYHNEVSTCSELLRTLGNRNTKDKYEIPEPIKDVNINTASHDKFLDLRDVYTFTIDSLHSECLDDALSFEELANGNFMITVYIADLSDIVIPQSDIDRYAYGLAETIYHNKPVPMLPDNIYNEYSSLRAGKDKLVHAYSFEINPEFVIVDTKINKAIIRVRDNYTYDKIDDLILNSELPFADELRKLYDYSKYLLKNNVRRQRYIENKEAIDPSRKLIDRYGNDPSNRIISELKVLVNSYLAMNAFAMDLPFIYRNNLHVDNKIDSHIDTLLGDSEFDKIRSILYSSFGTSYYSDINEGHYGLDLSVYAHVTTPLRNYSSLFNQRMVSNYMLDENFLHADSELLKILSKDLAGHLNKRIVLNKMYTQEIVNKRKTLTK